MCEEEACDPRRETSQGEWRVLGVPDGMLFYEVRCLIDGPGWSGPAADLGYRVVLGRSGGYLRRLNGRVTFADATSVLLTRPGDEMWVAHPLGCGDVYSCLEVPAEVLAGRPDADWWLDRAGGEGTADDRFELAHRLLLADARRGIDEFELAERLHGLLTSVIKRTPAGAMDRDDDVDRAAGRRHATLSDHRRLVNRTREVLASGGLGLSLTALAREVGSSPHHLSRVFHRVTGRSISTHRNQLRVRAVLDSLAEDGSSLRDVAARHHFADQAHLSRVLQRQLGHPPARLRRMLTPSSPG
ncbi:helix-turn-helix domain-containing protein [Plantactinospora siamensis]|uniref:Helix-turn-helix domain-containing protein n=1 Tax=Plantactinospora siamensis TaxID=555372 RepID=A0ABV6NPI6_9ACTN